MRIGKYTHLGVRVPEEDKEILSELAAMKEKTISEIVRRILKKYIAEEIKIEIK